MIELWGQLLEDNELKRSDVYDIKSCTRIPSALDQRELELGS